MKRYLLWLDGFIGIGAYWGALMMFIDPTGAMVGYVCNTSTHGKFTIC